MDINQKIIILNQEIEEMRNRWKNGSIAMRIHIEQKAKEKKNEIRILEGVLRRREHIETPPQDKLI